MPDTHQPFVPPDQHIPKFTWPTLLTGPLLGILFRGLVALPRAESRPHGSAGESIAFGVGVTMRALSKADER